MLVNETSKKTNERDVMTSCRVLLTRTTLPARKSEEASTIRIMATSSEESEEISINPPELTTEKSANFIPSVMATAVEKIVQPSSNPMSESEETSTNTAQSIGAVEESPTSPVNVEDENPPNEENHNQTEAPIRPTESVTHPLERSSFSDILESNLSGWDLNINFEKQTDEPQTTANIFYILDDPELNYSSEEVRDDPSNDLTDKPFDLEIDLGANVEAPNEKDSFISNPELNDDFDISEALKNQNSSLNSSDYVHASDIGNELDTTGNDSTTNNDSIPKIVYSHAGSIDNSQLVAKPRQNNKREDFCFFCKKMQTVISRHLETVHKDVEEVNRFAVLPKNNPERVQLIDLLRKKGNHLYNTSTEYNKDGKLLVARRPKEERAGTQYAPCHNCQVSLSKKSIRRHRQKCVGASKKGDRANTILSRRTDGRIHENASKKLQHIFAVFNDDPIVRLIRYDELLIEFGNGMAESYTKDQQQAMIRNRLRTLGRLLNEMKKCRLNVEPKITDFASIYDPGLYDCMLRAVNILARFNEDTGEHEVPSIVTSLGTYIKAVAEIALLVVRKKKDREKQLLLEDYIYIHVKQYGTKINRVAHESQAKQKRQKKKVLPSTNEIKKLQDYVVNKREEAFIQLSNHYSYSAWLELAKTTLITIQIFTRRRAGELERTTIADLKNADTVDETSNPEVYQSLSEEEKKYVGQYTRFIITGKLGRDVPVLLDSKMRECLDLLLRYRSATKITPKNPYVFGIPGFVDGRFKYLRACDLMREYSQECGAEHPERLRGTSLRKHMATVCAARNMNENQVLDIANFMGHAEQIHRSHYRQSVVARDVVGVAKILRSAIGQSEKDAAGNECTDENQNIELPSSEEKQFENSHRKDESSIVEAVQTKKKKRIFVPNSESGSSDEYEPNATDENDDDDDDDCDEDAIEQDEPARKRRKKNNSTKNKSTTSGTDLSKKRKLRWTPDEKVAAANAFGNGIKNGKLPSTAAMKKFLKDNPHVHRTVAQIRTWASNEKKKYQRG